MRRHCLSSRRGGLAGPLCAMLLSALPRRHTLRWLCASDEIRLYSGYRRCNLPSGLSSCSRVDRVRLRSRLARSEALSRAKVVTRRHAPAVLASLPLCQDHLLFVHSPHSSRCASLSRLLPAPAAVGVAQRLVRLSADPQTV